MTIASLAIAAVGAYSSYEQGKSSAEATAKSIEESQRLANETSALQQEQINKNAVDEKAQRSLEAMQERGRIRAILGESGLSGNTASRIEGESYFNEGTDLASIEANRQAAVKQSRLEAQGVAANNQSRLNSIKRPSALGAGLQIAGAGISAYDSYKTSRDKAKRNA